MSRFLGITREHVFSPGRVDDDSAILQMVAERLRQLGHEAAVIAGDDGRWPEPAAHTTVFAMCQGERALARLHAWAARGVRIVNHPQAILNCQRHHTVAALTAAAIPFPESVLLSTSGEPMLSPWTTPGGAWLKRGDVHATEPDDVVFVDSLEATRVALRRFAARRIGRVVLQRHVPGTVLKFYAVHTRFFHCVPPAGADHALDDDVLHRIQTLGTQAATVLNLEVYGGDCVHDVNGRVTLIDLNDWPSYAPCRAEAAKEIAAYLLAHDVARDT
jgi:hypothetical protein